jgi:hypothetical protein
MYSSWDEKGLSCHRSKEILFQNTLPIYFRDITAKLEEYTSHLKLNVKQVLPRIPQNILYRQISMLKIGLFVMIYSVVWLGKSNRVSTVIIKLKTIDVYRGL